MTEKTQTKQLPNNAEELKKRAEKVIREIGINITFQETQKPADAKAGFLSEPIIVKERITSIMMPDGNATECHKCKSIFFTESITENYLKYKCMTPNCGTTYYFHRSIIETLLPH